VNQIALPRIKVKATSKNVIPSAKARIHKLLTLLDSRLRGSDKLEIIRGSLNNNLRGRMKQIHLVQKGYLKE
jgi:hypothetical protein